MNTIIKIIKLLFLLSCARSLLVRLDFRLSESSEREISKLSKYRYTYRLAS